MRQPVHAKLDMKESYCGINKNMLALLRRKKKKKKKKLRTFQQNPTEIYDGMD